MPVARAQATKAAGFSATIGSPSAACAGSASRMRSVARTDRPKAASAFTRRAARSVAAAAVAARTAPASATEDQPAQAIPPGEANAAEKPVSATAAIAACPAIRSTITAWAARASPTPSRERTARAASLSTPPGSVTFTACARQYSPIARRRPIASPSRAAVSRHLSAISTVCPVSSTAARASDPSAAPASRAPTSAASSSQGASATRPSEAPSRNAILVTPRPVPARAGH